jgi:sigma-B regulation protein RsbU (phosphoserine phosphatase)
MTSSVKLPSLLRRPHPRAPFASTEHGGTTAAEVREAVASHAPASSSDSAISASARVQSPSGVGSTSGTVLVPPAPGSATTAAARWLFVRSFVRALTDHRTFDLRANPALWLGFVLALPIPMLAFAANASAFVVLLSIPAPVVWAVVLGAAGRVGILANEARARLEREVEEARRRAQKSEKALGREAARREVLEQQKNAVISELRLAQAVQSTLVPANVLRPEVEVAVRQIPCQYVGGDYLHATVVDDRWVYLAVADVSGHGIAAALVVARVHGLVRRYALEKKTPEGMLEELNRAALNILKHTYFFMTIGVFRLDLRDGTVDYATAGHPGQVLLRAEGKIEILRTPNRLLGMDADIFDADLPSATTRLEPGDTLVLFTDGLFEILGGEGQELLGEKELHKRIAGVRGLAPSLMVGEILQELSDFQGHSEFEDDLSLMVARYRGPERPGTASGTGTSATRSA